MSASVSGCARGGSVKVSSTSTSASASSSSATSDELIAGAGTVAGAEASTTIVPAARSPMRWRRWPVTISAAHDGHAVDHAQDRPHGDLAHPGRTAVCAHHAELHELLADGLPAAGLESEVVVERPAQDHGAERPLDVAAVARQRVAREQHDGGAEGDDDEVHDAGKDAAVVELWDRETEDACAIAFITPTIGTARAEIEP